MRGRVDSVAVDMLTVELRKRLAETNNLEESPARHAGTNGCGLGATALRIAQLATAMHMTAAAGEHRTGETPVPLARREASA